MHMQDVRIIARQFGIKTARMSKAGLIREIQRTEGNFDCFATITDGYCDHSGCCWRDDCLAASPGTTGKRKKSH